MLVMLQLVHSLVSPHNSKVKGGVALGLSPEREAASPCRDTRDGATVFAAVWYCGVQRLILVCSADSSEFVDPCVVQ